MSLLLEHFVSQISLFGLPFFCFRIEIDKVIFTYVIMKKTFIEIIHKQLSRCVYVLAHSIQTSKLTHEMSSHGAHVLEAAMTDSHCQTRWNWFQLNVLKVQSLPLFAYNKKAH